MKAIVAVDKNWAIGKDNKLLTHLPGDLKYFREQTLGKVLIMGRKTLESLPGGKPLPDRTTIVLTTNGTYVPAEAENAQCFVANNFDELMVKVLELEFLSGIDVEDDVMVAGGASVYEMLLPYCSEVLVTRIDAEFPADTYFPNLDRYVESGRMHLAWESSEQEENGIRYRFTRYER